MVNGTPESHVWELKFHPTLNRVASINKVTGEVIFYDKILKTSIANVGATYKIRKPIN